jgi:ribosome biogenesis protein ERB1
MAPLRGGHKRKGLEDVDESSDLEFPGEMLEGILSQSDNETGDESTDFEDFDTDPDESQSDLENETLDDKAGTIGAALDVGGENGEKGSSYRVVTDANGGERYEYNEVDPVYDSDDTDAQGPTNTIGNIPLTFYDSYPHIGYDINGKKIMRPATREALDALLDSIELPKGWTGLTDPETGKPLNLSQDELELLRRLQMGEVPEEGYDPYPVSENRIPSLLRSRLTRGRI